MPKRDMYAAADAGQALTYEASKAKEGRSKYERETRSVVGVFCWFLVDQTLVRLDVQV